MSKPLSAPDQIRISVEISNIATFLEDQAGRLDGLVSQTRTRGWPTNQCPSLEGIASNCIQTAKIARRLADEVQGKKP